MNFWFTQDQVWIYSFWAQAKQYFTICSLREEEDLGILEYRKIFLDIIPNKTEFKEKNAIYWLSHTAAFCIFFLVVELGWRSTDLTLWLSHKQCQASVNSLARANRGAATVPAVSWMVASPKDMSIWNLCMWPYLREESLQMQFSYGSWDELVLDHLLGP